MTTETIGNTKMSIEEKAKAYDEALKRAEAAIDIAADKDLVKGVATTIFPELKESEDERIRKHLVDMVKRETGFTGFPSQEQVLAYLEKQKEQKPVEWSEEEEKIRLKLRNDGFEAGKERTLKQFSDILEKWEEHAIRGMKKGASAYHQGKIALICDLRDWIKTL